LLRKDERFHHFSNETILLIFQFASESKTRSLNTTSFLERPSFFISVESITKLGIGSGASEKPSVSDVIVELTSSGFVSISVSVNIFIGTLGI
jgi:hypothetical protein